MDQLNLQLIGAAPLLMHQPRGVNPLDPLTQEVKRYTGKRKKTDEDHATISRLEWEAGLYYSDDLGVYIPGQNVEICFRDAAKMSKKGMDIVRWVYVQDDLPLRYQGRNGQIESVQKLWERNFKDIRRTVAQRNAVMRTRPMFPVPWSIDVPVLYQADRIERRELVEIAELAGLVVGLCDYRPRFGRFTVKVVED